MVKAKIVLMCCMECIKTKMNKTRIAQKNRRKIGNILLKDLYVTCEEM